MNPLTIDELNHNLRHRNKGEVVVMLAQKSSRIAELERENKRLENELSIRSDRTDEVIHKLLSSQTDIAQICETLIQHHADAEKAFEEYGKMKDENEALEAELKELRGEFRSEQDRLLDENERLKQALRHQDHP